MMGTMSDAVSEVIQKARDTAALPGMSKSQLAQKAGLSKNALQNLDDPNVVFRSDTLSKLETFLNKSPTQGH